MSREQILHGVILKKQTLRETDELITFYTKESGKVRFQARGVKKSTSKLQYGLQVLHGVELTVTNGIIPTIIGVHVQNSFQHIRSSEELVALFFWMAELVLKSTSDEESNGKLFTLITDALDYLNSGPGHAGAFKIKFLVDFLDVLGLAVSIPQDLGVAFDEIFFSNSAGGFVSARTPDSVPAPTVLVSSIWQMRQTKFDALPDIPDSELLFRLLSGFLSYQIERSINSTRFVSG